MIVSASKKLQVLQEQWHGCTRCGIHTMRASDDIYFGYGVPAPIFLIVGGVPTSADETFGGLFAGDPGSLLFQILSKTKIDLHQDCYLTYALSCRPKVIIPATELEEERLETREPSKEEYAACRPRLYEILYQTDPRAIITLGEVAARALLRGRMKFSEQVGKQFKMMMPHASAEDHANNKTDGKGRWFDVGYPVFTLPDMNDILVNPSTAGHGPLNVAIKTLERAKAYVEFALQAEQDTLEKGP